MRPRRTFTHSATCAVHGTSPRIRDLSSSSPNPPLHYLSPLDFEAQPLSSSPDLLGNSLPQGDRKLYKTRSPDVTLQNLHAPFCHLLPVLVCYIDGCVELSCVLRLSCIVLHLPCLCESPFVTFSFSHPNTQLQLQDLLGLSLPPKLPCRTSREYRGVLKYLS